MDRWFTVTEIEADTCAISEMQHLEETHAYLICGERRAALIDTGMGIGRMENVLRALGHLPDGYAGGAGRRLHDGDSIDLGGRSIEVLHTPGHSPGHCCFYERARRTLYTGDLVYRGQLDVYYPTTDPALFLHSLRRIAKLPVDRVCPGHHSLNVEPDLIGRVLHAAEHIDSQGRLCHGSGVFACGDFSIRL